MQACGEIKNFDLIKVPPDLRNHHEQNLAIILV